MKSVLGRAKRSVDNTFNAYLGRAAFAACLIGAIGLTLRGLWVFTTERYGTLAACLTIAAVLVLVGLMIRSVVIANEKAAKEEEAERARIEAEKNKQSEGILSGLPFDMSHVTTVLPLVMPMLRSAKGAASLIAIATALGGYALSSSKPQSADNHPAPAPNPESHA